ncbi:MAG: tRNA (adenosine(37)-N6)-threonylcarbamoyltransferase complex dimerization subunit type 1 TsaB [Nostocaceae cyanobacterium]|nr:tRNA (adenosine(37)-N6)-threonylcarbamoyltransferase complex dimerization subunit type 1 TsaB [Nostocaceae cyanobacterium]
MKSKAYGLALHTTTPELGLAIGDSVEELRSGVWHLERSLSSLMHQYLAEFIQPQTWADLAFIAVAGGPGGFTGPRIGVVTARTLAQQLDIPVFTISTMAAVAHSQADKAETIAVQMPAQRGQIFAGIYSRDTSPLLPDQVLTPEEWQQILNDLTTPYHLAIAEGGLGSTVKSIWELAKKEWQAGKRPHWSEALPFYGQHPVVMK